LSVFSPVPELTEGRSIKLNTEVSLRDRQNGVVSTGYLSPHPVHVVKPPANYFGRQFRSNLSNEMSVHTVSFQLVCTDCDTLGIELDYAEGAPLSTPIKCRGCGGLRGTLGDLRHLASSEQNDLFEVYG